MPVVPRDEPMAQMHWHCEEILGGLPGPAVPLKAAHSLTQNRAELMHAALCQDEARKEVRPTGEAPVFVAVDVDGQGTLWYGQLILCFIARYLGLEQLCYIRWLDSLHDLDAARIRPLTPREARSV